MAKNLKNTTPYPFQNPLLSAPIIQAKIIKKNRVKQPQNLLDNIRIC